MVLFYHAIEIYVAIEINTDKYFAEKAFLAPFKKLNLNAEKQPQRRTRPRLRGLAAASAFDENLRSRWRSRRRPLSTGRRYTVATLYAGGCAREDIYESLSQSFARFGNTREAAKGRGIPTSLRTFKSIFASSPPRRGPRRPQCVEATTRISLPDPAGFRLPFLGQIVASEPVAASRRTLQAMVDGHWCW